MDQGSDFYRLKNLVNILPNLSLEQNKYSFLPKENSNTIPNVLSEYYSGTFFPTDGWKIQDFTGLFSCKIIIGNIPLDIKCDSTAACNNELFTVLRLKDSSFNDMVSFHFQFNDQDQIKFGIHTLLDPSFTLCQTGYTMFSVTSKYQLQIESYVLSNGYFTFKIGLQHDDDEPMSIICEQTFTPMAPHEVTVAFGPQSQNSHALDFSLDAFEYEGYEPQFFKLHVLKPEKSEPPKIFAEELDLTYNKDSANWSSEKKQYFSAPNAKFYVQNDKTVAWFSDCCNTGYERQAVDATATSSFPVSAPSSWTYKTLINYNDYRKLLVSSVSALRL